MRKNIVRSSVCILSLVLTVVGSSANAQKKPQRPPATQPAAPQYQPPSDEAQLMMIRSTLIALNHANQTNNYSVLAGLSGPSFRAKSSPQSLSQTFESFRTNDIDLTPVTLLTPQLLQKASVVDGKLRIIGFFPSQPMQVNFDLSYEPVSGQWRLLNLGVNLQKK